MAKYHKYVFDIKKRIFLGKFEKMYKNETREGYDSWHQEDGRFLQRRFALSILQDYNFNFIIDVGCGKGIFTHLLKKKNNEIVGVDLSNAALKVAKARYPDIDFIRLNINNIPVFKNFLSASGKKRKIDLVIFMEVLSYVNNWKEILRQISKHAEYVLITLFIPEDPIGFIKSEKELALEVERYFEIIEDLYLRRKRCYVFFGRRKNVHI